MILLNGPPACGKSTLARKYVDEFPLTLNLDIDVVRGLLGRWKDDPKTAGTLARDIALASARTHLTSGHDVVVPQFLGRLPFIEQLENLAADVGAKFHEIVLLDGKENSLRRFSARSRMAAERVHRDAQEMLDREGGMEQLSAMYDRLMSVLDARPKAIVVRTEEGQVESAYRELLRSIS